MKHLIEYIGESYNPIHKFEYKSAEDFKKQMKLHKYVYFTAGDGESRGDICVFDTSKYDSFDEVLSVANKQFPKYYEYDFDKLLNKSVKTGKIDAFGFNHGIYHFGEDKSDNTAVLSFGYLDERPNEVWKLITMMKEEDFRYRGTFYEKDDYYKFHDDLWTVVHKK